MTPLTLYKALADSTRLQCLMHLWQEGERCVCDLTAALHTSQPKLSRHLAILKRADLLNDRRQGQWIYYRLNPHMPAWAYEVLRQTWLAQGPVAPINPATSCCPTP